MTGEEMLGYDLGFRDGREQAILECVGDVFMNKKNEVVNDVMYDDGYKFGFMDGYERGMNEFDQLMFA